MDNKIIEQTYLKWIMPSIQNRSLTGSDLDFRVKKAREQYFKGMEILEEKGKEKHKNDIIDCVQNFLKLIGMELFDKDGEKYNPRCNLNQNVIRGKIKYAGIKKDDNKIVPEGMKDKKDIVWIKFTKEGLISVIGVGCDIFFSDNVKENTTAGKIMTKLELEWDTSEVLIFPLRNIPKGLNRSDIESGIGNYLISEGIPILDFYSHNY